MPTRLIAVVLVVLTLGGLIAYSKFRPVPDRVSGFIEADEIRVGSRVGGRVAKVRVEEGQRVKAGEVLVELEPFDLLQLAEQARATLAAKEAQYQRLKSGLREEEVEQAKSRFDQLKATLDELVAGPRKEELDAARAELQVAQAQLQLAQVNFDRTRRLAETNAASREDLDRATEALGVAQGSIALQQARLALLEAGTREEEVRAAKARAEEARLAAQLADKGFRKEEIDEAMAARDAAQAALEVVNQQLAELVVRSPVDGVVEAMELHVGDLTSPSAPVLSIMDVSHLWVRAYVPENRLNLQVGQETSVAVDSFPDRLFPAKITFISRQAEFTPSNVQTPEERSKQVFRIKVELTEGLDVLRPGMSADVWLSEPARP